MSDTNNTNGRITCSYAVLILYAYVLILVIYPFGITIYVVKLNQQISIIEREIAQLNHENNNSALEEVIKIERECCDVDQNLLHMIIENAMKALGYIEISNQMADIRLEIDELTALVPRSNLSDISESHGRARTRTAAIHLTSGYGRFYSNKVFEGKTNTGMTIVGPWQVKSGIALKSGITTHDIGMCMVAPKHGIYHIYSQAYFQDEREDREYSNWNEYLHYTVLETDAYPDPITLMKSGRAEGIEKTPDLYYSSYHGGVFELRKGDKIFMKAYLPSSGITLDFRQESTFMGMFLVNEL